MDNTRLVPLVFRFSSALNSNVVKTVIFRKDKTKTYFFGGHILLILFCFLFLFFLLIIQNEVNIPLVAREKWSVIWKACFTFFSVVLRIRELSQCLCWRIVIIFLVFLVRTPRQTFSRQFITLFVCLLFYNSLSTSLFYVL